MQRLSYKLKLNIEYECELCKIIYPREKDTIWESSWVPEQINMLGQEVKISKEEIKPTIDRGILKSMSPVISQNEVDDFFMY